MKQGRTRKWIAVLLVLILAAGCVPAAQAAKKTKDIDSFALGSRGFAPWYYLPSTVPDGLLRETGSQTVSIYETSYTGSEGLDEYATSLTVEFVSGDEALKDVIVIEDKKVGRWENGETVTYDAKAFRIDFDQIKEPGRAVFHFTCESEHLLLERDVTLRILSWEDYPLMEQKEVGEENAIVVAKDGQVLDTQINARFMTLYADEIARKIAEDGEEIQIYTPYSSGELIDKKTGEYVNMHWYAVGASNNEETDDPVYRLMSPWEGEYGYWFKDYGVYEAGRSYELGNVATSGKVTIAVLPYRVSFSGSVAPGETAQISIVDDQPEAGRTFTWELQGEGVTLDADAGTLTAAEDAELGSTFTITATPSDGGYAITSEGKVAVGLLGGKKIDSLELYEGFSVPVLSEESGEFAAWQSHNNRYVSRTASDSAPFIIHMNSTVYDEDEFMEKPEDALRVYNSINLNGVTVAETQEFEKNGVPCKAWIGTLDSNGYLIGILCMGRNNRLAEIVLYSFANTGENQADAPRIVMNDMETLAELIGYDPSKASITVEDGAITVAPKKEGTTLIGGKKMAFAATFANKDKVNKKAKNDKITWSVVEKGTDAAPEFITIDKAGNLSAGAKLAEVKEVEVRASSDIFHTMGTYAVTVIPATKKITFDPAELNFYVGTDDPQTARAVMEPATVPPTGLTWTPSKKNAVEIVPGEDGTAVITPLAAGKITVTVKEPGGKSGVLKVNILQPVTGLTLTQKGKTKPGSAVTITAGLEPKTAGNKTLEWSVNVDESVATISQKGQLKIAKTAESGTVITVTCKALGAPEAITATIDVTVE